MELAELIKVLGRCVVVGGKFCHGADQVCSVMQEGDVVDLVHEADNAYDPNAASIPAVYCRSANPGIVIIQV